MYVKSNTHYMDYIELGRVVKPPASKAQSRITNLLAKIPQNKSIPSTEAYDRPRFLMLRFIPLFFPRLAT